VASALDQYRSAKADYIKLRSQAKKELIARFNELANDLLRIQAELLEDFGEKVQLPTKPRRVVGKRAKVTPVAAPAPEPAPSSKVTALQKRIDAQKKKVAELKAAGKATKTVEDRLYELEDELRLAQQ
jgi:hypothetical protein